jgi:hypothetical protein
MKISSRKVGRLEVVNIVNLGLSYESKLQKRWTVESSLTAPARNAVLAMLFGVGRSHQDFLCCKEASTWRQTSRYFDYLGTHVRLAIRKVFISQSVEEKNILFG